jgi:hypothetical protein
MRQATEQDRPALLALRELWKSKMPDFVPDAVWFIKWFQENDDRTIRQAFDITAKWRDRQADQGRLPTNEDVGSYASATMRHLRKTREQADRLMGSA